MPPGAASHGLRLGPFFETARADDGSRLLAVRPFYSRETSSDSRRREDDILWPLGIYSRRDDHFYWRALLAYGTGVSDDPTSPEDPWRFRIFPFIYAGRSQNGTEYGGFFPFYGSVRDFLVFHDNHFALFPIYAEGISPNGTEMRTILWPFYLTRHGDRIDQLRLWPFYGSSERRSLHSTRHDRFILWPFWNDTSSEGEIDGSGFVLFPLYGHSRYERRKKGLEESWSVIPPLFQYAHGDDGYRRLYAPWPFVRLLDNDNVAERHFWPIWGKTVKFDMAKRNDDATNAASKDTESDVSGSNGYSLERQYFLWPFFSTTEVDHDGMSSSVSHLPLPFYFHRKDVKQLPADESGAKTNRVVRHSYSRLWPLFSCRSVSVGTDGMSAPEATQIRVPELSLWSKSEQVERNWAPLWSLYTYRKKTDGAYCNDLFWGLLSWGRNSKGGAIFSLLWIPFAR